MGIKRRGNSMSLACLLLGVAVFLNIFIPAKCSAEDGLADMKTYYSPGSGHGSSSPHHGGSYGTQTYGGGSPGGSYNSPPTGGEPGGGSYNPPSSSGGYYNSPPTGGEPGGGSFTPPSSDGGYYNSPPTVGEPGGGSLTPPSSSGGYYNSPPTLGEPGGGSFAPPSSGGYYDSPPLGGTGSGFPSYTPPLGGGSGLGPFLPSPTTPTFDPHIGSPFFGTCGWWLAHPEAIWGLFGYVGTVGGIFGSLCTPVFGHDLSLPQALANTRNDGLGSLFREGTASFLNSMANQRFPFTTGEVRDRFTTALFSVDAAAAQADIFRQANEGRLRPRA